MTEIDKRILNIDKVLCDNIEILEFSTRELVSQNLLSQFRNLVEHIAIKIYCEDHEMIIGYEGIKAAMANLKFSNEYLFLRKFHGFLQQTASHYTPEYDGAERLVLKYYEYILQIQSFLKNRYDLSILSNLNKFPVNKRTQNLEYYTKIVEKLDIEGIYISTGNNEERFYIQKSKPFFVNSQVYYENTLQIAKDSASKFDRFVAFSNFELPLNYALKITMADEEIVINNRKMPIKIVTQWITSIRPCELNNFAKILDENIKIRSNDSEYVGLMNFLTKTGMSLVEVVEASDLEYNEIKKKIINKVRKVKLFNVIDKSREIILQNENGCNVLRYLLCKLNNKIIKRQMWNENNDKLSNLKLKFGCIPFDTMPFATSLPNHNPITTDLFECICSDGREHELLARHVNFNSINKGRLYTCISDVKQYGDIEELRKKFNRELYKTHQTRRLEVIGENIFISGYEEGSAEIISKLLELTTKGIIGYTNTMDEWLVDNPDNVDCTEKKKILRVMFQSSRIAMIYGAAGTGKSRLIRHISVFFDNEDKLFLTNTNPAIENLRRNVFAKNCDFMTISKCLYSNDTFKYDLLFIDESSMVSNNDMIKILNKVEYELLVLVGDVYQIEAIEFGNWFSMARYFIPDNCKYELKEPYRTKDDRLLKLWRKVRKLDEDITEYIVNCGFSHKLDGSIFEKSMEDEITLCLNYDGIYGINNINRFLQYSNPNPAIRWGVWTYKVNDPILFNESNRFEDVLYNNLKGKIIEIVENGDEIVFSIEVDRTLHALRAKKVGLELLDSQSQGKSIVRFAVNKADNTDEDNENINSIVPFQIAYAVSIHKAQGLEYDSVKLIITEEIDELITHNIFYTAITRTRKELQIYWTPESQQKVIESLTRDELKHDANILSKQKKLKMIKRKN